jgi:hypothetical protein
MSWQTACSAAQDVAWTPKRSVVRIAVALLLLVPATAGRAEPYGVGSTLRPMTLEDQHGKPAEVGASVRLLLVSRDMDGGNVVKEALADRGPSVLEERGAVYVADISGMPAMISRLIAVPRMRQRAYRVLLDRDGAATRDVPHVRGRPTLLALDAGRITRIAHLASAAELRAEIEK